jgi:hypothetical protein
MPSPTVARINGSPLGAMGTPTTNFVLGWNGSAWVPMASPPSAPSGTAGGDLNGSYPNPTVDGLNGTPTNVPPVGSLTAYDVLNWSGTQWVNGIPGRIRTASTASATPVITTDVNGEVWIAIAGIGGGYPSKCRDVLAASYAATGSVTAPGTTVAVVALNAKQFDDYGMWNAAVTNGPGFVVPVAGYYYFVGSISFTMTAAGQWAAVGVAQSGFRKGWNASWSGASGNMTCVCTGIMRCVANDVIAMWSQVSVAGPTIQVGSAYTTFLHVIYMGHA